MFEVVAKLLLHSQLKFEKGNITLLNQRICMIPVYNFVDIQKAMEKAGFKNALYLTSKQLGLEWTTKLKKQYKTNREGILEWGSNTVTLAGWGTVETLSVDPKKKVIRFLLHNSAISESYGPSKKPVDHIFRGMIAGAMSIAFGVDMEAVEIRCKSLGDPYCEFVVQPRKDFDLKKPLVKDQLAKK